MPLSDSRRPRAILAEDEDLPRAELRRMLAQAWPELEIVADQLEADEHTRRQHEPHQGDEVRQVHACFLAFAAALAGGFAGASASTASSS